MRYACILFTVFCVLITDVYTQGSACLRQADCVEQPGTICQAGTCRIIPCIFQFSCNGLRPDGQLNACTFAVCSSGRCLAADLCARDDLACYRNGDLGVCRPPCFTSNDCIGVPGSSPGDFCSSISNATTECGNFPCPGGRGACGPAPCTSDAQCPTTPFSSNACAVGFCDTTIGFCSTRSCIEANSSNICFSASVGCVKACQTSAECTQDAPICTRSPSQEDTLFGCVPQACLSDAQCAILNTNCSVGVCGANNFCRRQNCASQGLVCNAATGTCVACTTNAQCRIGDSEQDLFCRNGRCNVIPCNVANQSIACPLIPDVSNRCIVSGCDILLGVCEYGTCEQTNQRCVNTSFGCAPLLPPTTPQPTQTPTRQPTAHPTPLVTGQPTGTPTRQPTAQPTQQPDSNNTVIIVVFVVFGLVVLLLLCLCFIPALIFGTRTRREQRTGL